MKSTPAWLLLLALARPQAADDVPEQHLELYETAVRLLRDRYLYPEELDAGRLLASAADEAERRVPWLLAEERGGLVTLKDGELELASLGVSSMDELPAALARLEDVLLGAPDPLEPDFHPEVVLLQGVTRALDHPTTVLTGNRLQSFDERLRGTLSGIGARLGLEEGEIVVHSVFPDGPARRAGLPTGDVILRVDGISTVGMGVRDAVDRIRGPAGSTVVLEVRRGERTLELSIRRARIRIPNLESRLLPSGVGYISISHFSEQTVVNLRRALAELASKGGLERGLVLDLRGNTGGSMIQAARSADQFLSEGRLVYTEGRNGASVSNLIREIDADDEGTEPPIPLVVLVDRRTASGAEILAGSLALLDRAVLVGERTYGKGTVQKIFNLRGDLRLKMTVAEYLLAGDVRVAGHGLDPDLPTALVVLDHNGARWEEVRGEGRIPPLRFVELRPGWSSEAEDEASAEDEDPELSLAERIVLEARGPHREEILAAARRVAARVREEQDRELQRDLALRGIDWSPAPAGVEHEGPPRVALSLVTDGPPRAGEPVPVRVQVQNLSGETLYRVLVELHSENPRWEARLPVGRIEPEGSAEGLRVLRFSPRTPDRLDRVSLVLRADGWPATEPEEHLLRIEGRPEPAIAVEGRLLPEGEGAYEARLELRNLGPEALGGIQLRFDFPADEAIELRDREAIVQELEPGKRASASLHLALREGFEDDHLPLQLELRAERWGSLLHRADFPLPLDGEPVELQPPRLELELPLQATSGEETCFSFRARDESSLRHLLLFHEDEKLLYLPGHAPELSGQACFAPLSGSNALFAVVEDDDGLQARRQGWVLGLPAEDPASDASDEAPPTRTEERPGD